MWSIAVFRVAWEFLFCASLLNPILLFFTFFSVVKCIFHAFYQYIRHRPWFIIIFVQFLQVYSSYEEFNPSVFPGHFEPKKNAPSFSREISFTHFAVPSTFMIKEAYGPSLFIVSAVPVPFLVLFFFSYYFSISRSFLVMGKVDVYFSPNYVNCC